MSAKTENTMDRVQGAAQEFAGNVKKNVGSAVGNENMESSGARQEKEGQARQESAKAAERTRGQGEELRGNVKETVGGVLGNDRLKREGEAEQISGEARQKANS